MFKVRCTVAPGMPRASSSLTVTFLSPFPFFFVQMLVGMLFFVCAVSAIDIGPALIDAVKQVNGRTPNSRIDSLARSVMDKLRRAGVSSRKWVHEMIYQKRGYHQNVRGDRTKYLARVTKGRRLGVLGPRGARTLRGLVDGNSGRSSSSSSSSSGGGGVFGRLARRLREDVRRSGRRATVREARDYVSALAARKGNGQTSAKLARARRMLTEARFSRAARSNAMALLALLVKVLQPYNNIDHFRRDIALVRPQARRCNQQGTLTLKVRKELEAFSDKYSEKHRRRTTAEVEEGRQNVLRRERRLIGRAESAIRQCKSLRRYVDGKNGWTSTGMGDATALRNLIGGRRGVVGGLGAKMERELRNEEWEKLRVSTKAAEGYLGWLKGPYRDAVAGLTTRRENGYWVLGKSATVAGYVPVLGKPIAVTLRVFESGTRYLSGDLTASEAAANILVEGVSAGLGNKIKGAGSIVSRSMRSAIEAGTYSLTKDLARVLSDRKLTADQRVRKIKGAIARAVLKAFQAAVTQSINSGIDMGDDATKAALYKKLFSLGVSFGLTPRVINPILAPLK